MTTRRACPWCGKWFDTPALLKKHKETVKNKESSRHILGVGRVTKKEHVKHALRPKYGVLEAA